MAKITSLKEPVEDLFAIRELLKGKVPLIWIFTGDSITQGAKHTNGYRSYQEIFAERLRWEMGRVNDFVINTAFSGNTSKDIVANFEWRVAQFRPKIVSLMIGTNDAAKVKNISLTDFKNNITALINNIRALKAIPILHTPNIIIAADSGGREDLAEYVTIIREIAKTNNVILIDHYEYWSETLVNNPGIKVYKKWLNDPLHPNGTGHLSLARLMFKKLDIFDKNAFTCAGEIYETSH